jgi:hypothetical protein
VTTARHGLTRDALTADQQAFVVPVARFVEDLRKSRCSSPGSLAAPPRRTSRWPFILQSEVQLPRVTPEEHDIPPLGIPERDIEPLFVEDAETPAVRGLLAAGTATFSWEQARVVAREAVDLSRAVISLIYTTGTKPITFMPTSWLSGVTGA